LRIWLNKRLLGLAGCQIHVGYCNHTCKIEGDDL
jgi:hypothetical protein